MAGILSRNNCFSSIVPALRTVERGNKADLCTSLLKEKTARDDRCSSKGIFRTHIEAQFSEDKDSRANLK